MTAYEIIDKKKNGIELSTGEINFIVDGFTKGTVSDSQMAAFMMAVCFMSMNKKETADLTMAMVNSGDVMDLSSICGIKVDKHSTGGVGDKTSLIISPVVAFAGVPIAKMSGRGLGHTGGTVDKLESIKGLRTEFSSKEFIDIVNKTNICIAGQSAELAPADKKMYALRDITATVDSIPLIASSIMSKKIAAGSDAILLDVKTGKGAFMKTLNDSITLAKAMVSIGESVGRKTVALITDMDVPLGNCIGNSLEIVECVKTLKGNGPKDLTALCIELAANMILLGKQNAISIEDARVLASEIIYSGKAVNTFAKMVNAQGGDESFIYDIEKFEKAAVTEHVFAETDGFINSIDAKTLGQAAVLLGAGREVKNAPIDFSAGIVLLKKPGEKIKKGDAWAVAHTSHRIKLDESLKRIKTAISISDCLPNISPLIFCRVDKDGTHKFN